MRSSILLAAVAAFAVPAVAQGSMDLDKASPGALGGTLTLDWGSATPGGVLLVIPSLQSGPTPLSLVDPGDGRSLQVGLDLGSSWFLLPLSQATGSIPLPVPNLSTLAGLSLRFQTLTYPGTTRLFGQMSNVVAAQLGAPGTGTPLTPGMSTARALAVAIADRNDDAGGGNFLIAGGGQGTFLSAIGLRSTERYDFRKMVVSPGPNMTVARALAAAVELQNGQTLLIGGVDAVGNVLASCEVYDPVTNAFRSVAPMPGGPRAIHDAALLSNGRVLVVGGTNTFADALSALANAKDTTEIYDPVTNTWSNGPTFPYHVLGCDVTTLADGRVLASGGFRVDSVIGIPIPLGGVATCKLLNAAATSWSAAASMHVARGGHFGNTVRLLDGRVLVTGGATSGPDLTQATPVAQAEVYDPMANAWTSLPNMASARALHTATLLPDGRVVVAGGATGTLTAPVPIQSVQVFLPATNSWQTLPGLPAPRGGHTAVRTPDGLVLLFGGEGAGGSSSLTTVETLRP